MIDEQNPDVQPEGSEAGAQAETSQPAPKQPAGKKAKSGKPKSKSTGGASAKSVFGVGFGRVATIAGVSAVALLALWGAFGVRSTKMAQKNANVDMPNVPASPMNVAVTPEERLRRQEQSQREFERAQRTGETYHTQMELHDREEGEGASGNASFRNLRSAQSDRAARRDGGGASSGDEGANSPEQASGDSSGGSQLLAGMRTGPIQLSDAPGGDGTVGGSAGGAAPQNAQRGQQRQQGQQGQQGPTMQEQVAAARAAEEAEFEAKLARARQEREEYIAGVRQQGILQARLLTGDEAGGSVFSQMGLSTGATWATPTLASYATPVDTRASAANAAEGLIDDDYRIVVGAGEMLYATLDAEVDTDDGDLVLATIRGGKFDGRRVMGRVEQTTDNIRLHFDTMSGRKRGSRTTPSVAIDAIALRAEDAKQGIADVKDRHLISRLAAIAVTSLLTGYGEAWGTTTGTTTISGNGTVITTTTDEPTHRRIRGNIARSFGTTLANEFSDEISRKPTYRVMAGKGFVLLFLTDLDQNDMGGNRYRDPSLVARSNDARRNPQAVARTTR